MSRALMALSLSSARLRLRPLTGKQFQLAKISELEEFPTPITEIEIIIPMEKAEVDLMTIK